MLVELLQSSRQSCDDVKKEKSIKTSLWRLLRQIVSGESKNVATHQVGVDSNCDWPDIFLVTVVQLVFAPALLHKRPAPPSNTDKSAVQLKAGNWNDGEVDRPAALYDLTTVAFLAVAHLVNE